MANNEQAGWIYWLNYSQMIEKVSRRFAADSSLDSDDFKQELLMRLVRRHSDYDPSRCRPVTWAWWQARAVRNKLQTREMLLFDATHEQQTQDSGAFKRQMEACADLEVIRPLLSTSEWTLANHKAAGCSEKELQSHFNCSAVTARRRLKKIAERLENHHG